jgi:hypothetical protein
MAEQTFLEAATPYLVLTLGAVVIPLQAFLVKSVFTVRGELTAHEATDTEVFKGINEKLSDLKADSTAQTVKLDEIRDRMPRKRTR